MIFLESPAKINLDLFITGKRQDGFHLLSTHMLAIDLVDHITIQKATQNQLFSDVFLGPFEKTLFGAAYRALLQFVRVLPTVEVHLKKNIFIGAGLGGGSSNAATFLFGMNQLFSLGLNEKQLKEVAQLIGADVSFFFSQGFALCKGVGEELHPPMIEPKDQYWIVHPKITSLTKEVYSRVKIEHIDLTSKNHLMKFAFEAYPELEIVYRDLLQQDPNCWVTGSGSCIICEKKPNLTALEVKPLQRESNQWYRTLKTREI